MILFINVFITNKRISPVNRFNLPQYDRLDVFKYTLASYASIDMWTQCIFNIKLDDSFLDRRTELTEYIHSLFPNNATINWSRLEYIRDWRVFIDEHLNTQQLVWLATDDDHVFIDSELEYLDMVVSEMEQDVTPLRALHYSHWPEHLCNVAQENHNLSACQGRVRITTQCWWDSIQIMSRELIQAIFFNNSLMNDYYIPRCNLIDEQRYCQPLDVKYYVSVRELCRHFDGYGNVDGGGLHTVTPPLMIPPGFFTDDIKILYCGGRKRREGWVNIDPTNEKYYAESDDGTDYKMLLEDVPYCWRNKITQIEVKNIIKNDILISARNKAFMEHLTTDKVNYRSVLRSPPEEWFQKELK
jgi:hypothetical protein